MQFYLRARDDHQLTSTDSAEVACAYFEAVRSVNFGIKKRLSGLGGRPPKSYLKSFVEKRTNSSYSALTHAWGRKWA